MKPPASTLPWAQAHLGEPSPGCTCFGAAVLACPHCRRLHVHRIRPTEFRKVRIIRACHVTRREYQLRVSRAISGMAA